MKRIGILTAGGDTPALNATIQGAVVRCNQLKIEIFGFIKGFNSLFNPKVPHVHLNPLYQEIPELDPTKGGTLIGSSRDYVDPEDAAGLDQVVGRLHKLGIEGLICDTYVESVKLWPDSGELFHHPPDRTTASAFEWMTWILQHVARWKHRSRVVPLAFDPAEVVVDGSALDQTMTSVPDREEVARRVRSLAALFPEPIPDLESRLRAGGTLPLLLVADQLEVAAAMPPAGRTMWSLQTIAGRTVPQIAEAMDLTENNVRVQLSNVRKSARDGLVELWLPHAPPAPPSEGRANE